MKIALIKTDEGFIPYSDEDKESYNKLKGGAIYEAEVKDMDMRTLAQNRAYWKWCDLISNCLNNAGLYIVDVIKVETVWNKDNLHANVMLPTIKKLYNKTSTTKLKKDEYEIFIDVITNAFSSKGVVIPEFPNKDKG